MEFVTKIPLTSVYPVHYSAVEIGVDSSTALYYVASSHTSAIGWQCYLLTYPVRLAIRNGPVAGEEDETTDGFGLSCGQRPVR